MQKNCNAKKCSAKKGNARETAKDKKRSAIQKAMHMNNSSKTTTKTAMQRQLQCDKCNANKLQRKNAVPKNATQKCNAKMQSKTLQCNKLAVQQMHL